MPSPIVTTQVPISHYGRLMLPCGKLVRDCSDSQIRAELTRLDVPGANSDGLSTVLQRYHEMLEKIWDAAGRAAVDEFLAKHKD